jgi:hypothetical protein
MPDKSVPLRRGVGGVSEEAAAKAGGSHPFAIRSFAGVTVKGILAAGKAALFAERRQNGGLGRSGACFGYPPGVQPRR